MPKQSSILVADDDPGIREVMAHLFSSRGYQCRTAQNGREAMSIFGESRSQAVLSDVHMADMNGLEVTRNVLDLSPTTAVVLMTGNADLDMAIQALRLGASDFLLKPFDFKTAECSVQAAITKKQSLRDTAQELARLKQRLQNLLATTKAAGISAMESFCKTLEIRDVETYDHMRRVSNYACCLARKLGLSAQQQEDIQRGALLHDIGKVVVPDRILLKPGPLTEGEWSLMKKHVETGYRIVTGIPGLEQAAQTVRQHHERYDGSGYPQGLRGEQICLGARIFAVSDTYDAMTRDRPYRKGLSDDAAREEIRRHAGIQFDPRVVRAFLQIPVGDWVRAGSEPQAGQEVFSAAFDKDRDPATGVQTGATSLADDIRQSI